MTLSTSVHDIKALVLSFHPVIVIETVEEDRVKELLASVASQARLQFFQWSLTQGLSRNLTASTRHGVTVNPMDLLSHLRSLTVEGIFLLKDFTSHLAEAATARQFRELTDRFARTRSALVLTGATVTLPPEIEAQAVRYELCLPGPEELATVLKNVTRSLNKSLDRDLLFTDQEEEQLIRALRGLTLNQARQAVSHAIIEDGGLSSKAIQAVMQRKVQMVREGGLLEYYPLEDNQFELGGFQALKGWLERAAVGFTKEARALNLNPPKGILLVGVQGCGKSLAAKVTAKQWNMPLLKLDMGRLYDKYVGETEKNFRRAIAMAESISPSVLWLDEIEKGLSSTSGGQADGGVGVRMFGAFLTWLQEKKEGVFVVATANDLSALPPELMRKGRFDEIFFVDLPNAEEREAIFEIHLRLRKQHPKRFALQELVRASEGFSGAEIEQAVISALYRALHQKRVLDTGLLEDEMRQTVPLSVSRREDIDRLRAFAQDRFVSVR